MWSGDGDDDLRVEFGLHDLAMEMKQGGCLKEHTDVGKSKDQESAAGTHSTRRNQRNTVAVERNSGEKIRRP